MPALRSRTVTHGRNMAGARALLRATGVAREDIGKPIIAVANSFTEFVPGHVHLREVGQVVADAIRAADAMICISNCDKITPGMLIATMRLNIPTVFVSGGPMEAGAPAGLAPGAPGRKLDLIDSMVASADPSVSDDQLLAMEESACPTCGSCSGMFTANSMNCLTEAIGLALPGNGSTLATHTARRALFERAGRAIVEITRQYYADGDESVLPRAIASRDAFENAMALDVAMGGSNKTILQ